LVPASTSAANRGFAERSAVLFAAGAALPTLLALLPLLALIWMCARLYVDVPFWDQWELVPRLDKLDRGTLTVRDFWGQHNEHRPMFPILVMLTLARLSRWNVALEIALNVTLGATMFALFARHARVAWGSLAAMPPWLLPLVALLVFSPVQWENWTWGWQMTTLMGAAASIGGLALVAEPRAGHLRIAAAIACGVVATYSFAAGLAYWLVGFAALLVGDRPARRTHAALWLIVAGATFASYFYDFRAPVDPAAAGGPPRSLEELRAMAHYVIAYAGAPLAGWNVPLASALGAAVIAGYLALVMHLWRDRHQRAVLFPIIVGLFALSVGGMAALGRAHQGTAQALASRYTTLSTPLWVAVVLLGALALRGGAHARVTRWNVAAAGVALCLMLLSASSGYQGLQLATGRSQHLRPARRGLMVGTSTALLLRLYPDATIVRERRLRLQAMRRSVFR
jgi:hypothetical protein